MNSDLNASENKNAIISINLTNASPYPLHEKMLQLVKEERRLTGLVIENLQNISNQNIHLVMGYSSLFDYCTRALGYSESCAYRRISAVRVSNDIPEIKKKLDQGTLTLTTVSMAQTLFRKTKLSPEQKRDVISKIEHKSKLQTEKILINVFNEGKTKDIGLTQPGGHLKNQDGKALFKTQEKITVVSETRSKMQLTVDHSLLEKLDRIKQLRSHKNPNMSYEQLLNDMSDYILKKLDPKLKVQIKSNSIQNKSKYIRYVPAKLKQQIFTHDNHQCSYKNPKTLIKCTSQHLLEIDHIQPIYAGGETMRNNLRVLCKAHNLLRNK